MATNYGRDVSCASSLVTGRFVSGPRLVAEAIFRRLTTPRGMLRGGDEEADYGIDLLDLVGQDASPSVLAALPGQIKAECLKDERVEDVSVSVSTTRNGPSVTILVDISVAALDGEFTLQLGVSEVTIELLGIEVTS